MVLLLVAGSGVAQTYQVGSDSAAKPGASADRSQAPGQPLGFGSNIENARLARGAELALQRGDHALALDYAQRAAQAAPDDPQLWFLLGYAARLNGKYSVSIQAYQRGLKLNPSSVNGLSGLAQTYSMTGQTAEAESLFKQVIAADPRRRYDLAALGELYLRRGDYTSALEWLGKAEAVEPAAQSELLMANAYQHLKQMDESRRYLELAKSRAPNNPDIDRSLAAFYRDTGDYAKAVEALTAIRSPKPDVVAELAYTYGLDGKWEDSARFYTQAANLLPRDIALQLSAAQAQVSVGALDHATPFLDRAARIDPNAYRLHAIRGEMDQLQENDAAAAREYQAAIARLPAAPVEGPLYGIQLRMTLEALYRNLDEQKLATEQLQTARGEINKLDERGADRTAFLALRARIRMDSGQLDAALADMTEALSISPHDPSNMQLDGDLLMKLGRTADAVAMFKQVLALDPKSRFALTSLGYASRADGNNQEAQKYFVRLEQDYPKSYVPYLALGDLYTAIHEYKEAQDSYTRGYALAPWNSLIVAGGMSAAIEGHDLPLAGEWSHRVTEKMAIVPQVLREEERYLSFKGDSRQSAEMGRKAIQLMPNDRDVVVYLGYDLLHLEEWAELQTLAAKYKGLFPKDPAIPLLAGYVDKHNGDLELAAQEFTEALNRDPEAVTAYTNRGYVLNDVHQPAKAAADFELALKREPKNAEARMGLAFAELNQHHWREAVHQTQLAEEVAGASEQIHTIRATAYGGQGMLTKSAAEYRAAIKLDPTDGSLHLGLGNILFAQRRYGEAVAELQTAQKYLPESAPLYALMARANAALKNRGETLRDVQLAEKYAGQEPKPTGKPVLEGPSVSDIYISTGQALSALGDQQGAMDRFSKALLAPKSKRVSVRLAIARLMAAQSHPADAERQIALAQMEVDAGDAPPPTGEEYIETADILQQMHEYQLSETYLERAKSAGAPDPAVRIGLANGYLALGETRRAAAELAAVKRSDDAELDYQYLLATASLYQQEHQSAQALSAFGEAANDAGEDQTAETDLLQAGGDEGIRLNRHFSALSNLTVQPIFEDSTVYVLDSKLDSPAGPVQPSNTAALPPPRSSIETNWINAFHLHFHGLPTNGGYFQIRNARGIISVPATSSIVHRNTTDYAVNFGLDPTVHLGNNVVTFNSGIQGTIRRDSLSPVQLNQNLFRVFTYATTSSFVNAVSADGFFTAEFGPFTETPMNGRSLTGAIDFRVGAPWSKTKLITGWGTNDQLFTSSTLGNSEDYFTSSYIGLSRRFSQRFTAEAIVEDLRTWRVVPFSPLHSAISQALRPAGTIEFAPARYWDIRASGSYESTRGFHVYDMTQNGIALSYTRPLDHTFNDATGKVRLKYPIRFSAGIQEETFPNFGHGPSQQFRPYVSITVF